MCCEYLPLYLHGKLISSKLDSSRYDDVPCFGSDEESRQERRRFVCRPTSLLLVFSLQVVSTRCKMRFLACLVWAHNYADVAFPLLVHSLAKCLLQPTWFFLASNSLGNVLLDSDRYDLDGCSWLWLDCRVRFRSACTSRG